MAENCPKCSWRELKPKQKICDACRTRIWREKNPRLAAYFNLKRSAQKREIEFLLTFEEFWQVIRYTKYIQRKGRGEDSLQIDRIREDEGYTRDNIQVTTKKKNKEKWYSWFREHSATAKHYKREMENLPF